jgi:hypothetical protein
MKDPFLDRDPKNKTGGTRRPDNLQFEASTGAKIIIHGCLPRLAWDYSVTVSHNDQ